MFLRKRATLLFGVLWVALFHLPFQLIINFLGEKYNENGSRLYDYFSHFKMDAFSHTNYGASNWSNFFLPLARSRNFLHLHLIWKMDFLLLMNDIIYPRATSAVNLPLQSSKFKLQCILPKIKHINFDKNIVSFKV